MCEKKRRHLQKNEKHVQLGYYAFTRFYKPTSLILFELKNILVKLKYKFLIIRYYKLNLLNKKYF